MEEQLSEEEQQELERLEKIAALERIAQRDLLPFVAPAATLVGRVESSEDYDAFVTQTILVAVQLRVKFAKAAKDYAELKIEKM